jgi:hypothetical protein
MSKETLLKLAEKGFTLSYTGNLPDPEYRSYPNKKYGLHGPGFFREDGRYSRIFTSSLSIAHDANWRVGERINMIGFTMQYNPIMRKIEHRINEKTSRLEEIEITGPALRCWMHDDNYTQGIWRNGYAGIEFANHSDMIKICVAYLNFLSKEWGIEVPFKDNSHILLLDTK